jgi:formamidopyrimidine-DNA glycosylase
MPEGHTVHRLADALTARLGGREVAASSPQGRFADGAATIDGHRLDRVTAHGKHLFFELAGTDAAVLHVHLGLGGRIEGGEGPPPQARGAIRLRLIAPDAWMDLRMPMICELVDASRRDAIVARLGPDLIDGDPDPAAARARVTRSRVAIGALLLDQAFFAGIGNAYRAEALYRCGIDPRTPGRDLTAKRFDALFAECRRLLAEGRRTGRVMTVDDADLHGPLGEAAIAADLEALAGFDREADDDEDLTLEDVARGRSVARARARQAYVYGRTGLPCRRCGTPVRTALVGGRDAYWCPRCQHRLRRRASATGGAKGTKAGAKVGTDKGGTKDGTDRAGSGRASG